MRHQCPACREQTLDQWLTDASQSHGDAHAIRLYLERLSVFIADRQLKGAELFTKQRYTERLLAPPPFPKNKEF